MLRQQTDIDHVTSSISPCSICESGGSFENDGYAKNRVEAWKSGFRSYHGGLSKCFIEDNNVTAFAVRTVKKPESNIGNMDELGAFSAQSLKRKNNETFTNGSAESSPAKKCCLDHHSYCITSPLDHHSYYMTLPLDHQSYCMTSPLDHQSYCMTSPMPSAIGGVFQHHKVSASSSVKSVTNKSIQQSLVQNSQDQQVSFEIIKSADGEMKVCESFGFREDIRTEPESTETGFREDIRTEPESTEILFGHDSRHRQNVAQSVFGSEEVEIQKQDRLESTDKENLPAQDRLESADKENLPAQDRLESADKENLPAQDRLESADKENLPAQDCLESADKENLPAQDRLESADKENLPAQDCLESADKENLPAQDRLESADKENLPAQNRLESADKENLPAQDRLESADKENLPAQDRLESADKENLPAQDRLESTDKENLPAQDRLESADKENLPAQDHLESADKENLPAQDCLESADKENLPAQDRLESADKENLPAQDHLESADKENLPAQDCLESADKENLPAQDCLESADKENLPAQDCLESADKENLPAQDCLESADKENLPAQDCLESADKENLPAQDCLESADKENLPAQDCLESADKENLPAQDCLESADKENLPAQDHLESADKENLPAQDRLESADKENLPAQDHLESADKENLPAQDCLESADKENLPAQDCLESADKENLPAQDRLESTDKENLPAQDRLESADKENLPAQDHLESADKENLPAQDCLESADKENLPAQDHLESADKENLPAQNRLESTDKENLPAQDHLESTDKENLPAQDRLESADKENLPAQDHLESADKENLPAQDRLESTDKENLPAQDRQNLPAASSHTDLEPGAGTKFLNINLSGASLVLKDLILKTKTFISRNSETGSDHPRDVHRLQSHVGPRLPESVAAIDSELTSLSHKELMNHFNNNHTSSNSQMLNFSNHKLHPDASTYLERKSTFSNGNFLDVTNGSHDFINDVGGLPNNESSANEYITSQPQQMTKVEIFQLKASTAPSSLGDDECYELPESFSSKSLSERSSEPKQRLPRKKSLSQPSASSFPHALSQPSASSFPRGLSQPSASSFQRGLSQPSASSFPRAPRVHQTSLFNFGFSSTSRDVKPEIKVDEVASSSYLKRKQRKSTKSACSQAEHNCRTCLQTRLIDPNTACSSLRTFQACQKTNLNLKDCVDRPGAKPKHAFDETVGMSYALERKQMELLTPVKEDSGINPQNLSQASSGKVPCAEQICSLKTSLTTNSKLALLLRNALSKVHNHSNENCKGISSTGRLSIVEKEGSELTYPQDETKLKSSSSEKMEGLSNFFQEEDASVRSVINEDSLLASSASEKMEGLSNFFQEEDVSVRSIINEDSLLASSASEKMEGLSNFFREEDVSVRSVINEDSLLASSASEKMEGLSNFFREEDASVRSIINEDSLLASSASEKMEGLSNFFREEDVSVRSVINEDSLLASSASEKMEGLSNFFQEEDASVRSVINEDSLLASSANEKHFSQDGYSDVIDLTLDLDDEDEDTNNMFRQQTDIDSDSLFSNSDSDGSLGNDGCVKNGVEAWKSGFRHDHSVSECFAEGINVTKSKCSREGNDVTKSDCFTEGNDATKSHCFTEGNDVTRFEKKTAEETGSCITEDMIKFFQNEGISGEPMIHVSTEVMYPSSVHENTDNCHDLPASPSCPVTCGSKTKDRNSCVTFRSINDNGADLSVPDNVVFEFDSGAPDVSISISAEAREAESEEDTGCNNEERHAIVSSHHNITERSSVSADHRSTENTVDVGYVHENIIQISDSTVPIHAGCTLTYSLCLDVSCYKEKSRLPVLFGHLMESDRELGLADYAISHTRPTYKASPTSLILSELVQLAQSVEKHVSNQALSYLYSWLDLYPPVSSASVFVESFQLNSSSSVLFDIITDVSDKSKRASAVSLLEYFVAMFDVNFNSCLRSGNKALLQKSLISKWLQANSFTFTHGKALRYLLRLFEDIISVSCVDYRACYAVCALLGMVGECLRLASVQWDLRNPRFTTDCVITLCRRLTKIITSSCKKAKRKIMIISMFKPAWVRALLTSIILSDYSDCLLSHPIKLNSLSLCSIFSQFFFLVPEIISEPGQENTGQNQFWETATSKHLAETSAKTKIRRKDTAEKVNKRNGRGESAVHVACIKNKVGRLQELLAVPGVDVNLRDNSGWTPLHEACNKGNISCVQLLLDYVPLHDVKEEIHKSHRVEIDAKAYQGRTPLHDAVIARRPDICTLLLKYGGKKLLESRNHFGLRAIDFPTSDEVREVLNSFNSECSASSIVAEMKTTPQDSQFKERAYHGRMASRSSCRIFLKLLSLLLTSYCETLDTLKLSGHSDTCLDRRDKDMLRNMAVHVSRLKSHIRKLTEAKNYQRLQFQLQLLEIFSYSVQAKM